jgi:hypothetical protein
MKVAHFSDVKNIYFFINLMYVYRYADGIDWGTLVQKRDAYVERLNGIYARYVQFSNLKMATIFNGLQYFSQDQ